MSTGFPVLLRSDHKILGSEYCSGYTDVFGKWNTGFYCPQSESKTAVSCCGIPTYKYCCTTRDSEELGTTTEGTEVSLAPYLIRAPVILGIIAGVLLMLILVIITSCYFCACCLCYKKRRAHIPPGLYRMPLASSSTTSGLMNVYSPSSNFNSPLDMEWHHIQQGFSNSAANGHILHHNQLNNQSQTQPQPSLPEIRQNHANQSNGSASNRNGAIFTTQGNGWLANSYNNQQYPYLTPSINNNSHSTLPRYFHYHQGNNNVNTNRNSNPTPSTYSNNSLRRPERPPRIDNNAQAQAYYGFTLGNESRPYVISDGHMDTRPRSVISFRNNVAYITSTLPLTNSFTTSGPRRNVRFGNTTTMNSGTACSEPRNEPISNGTGANSIKSCNINNPASVIAETPGAADESGTGTSPSVPEESLVAETESQFKGLPRMSSEDEETRSVSETELTTSFGTFSVKTEGNRNTANASSNSSNQVEVDTLGSGSVPRPMPPLIETHRIRI